MGCRVYYCDAEYAIRNATMHIDSTLKRVRELGHSTAGVFKWITYSLAAGGLAGAAFLIWAPAGSAMDEPDRPPSENRQREKTIE